MCASLMNVTHPPVSYWKYNFDQFNQPYNVHDNCINVNTSHIFLINRPRRVRDSLELFALQDAIIECDDLNAGLRLKH
jgi:hypothetical protein